MMIGVYNQLLNARYLGSITILSFGAWIPRDSFLCLACYFFQLNISNRTSLNPCHVFDAMGASCSEADIFRVTKVGVEWTVRSIEKVSLKGPKTKKTWSEIGKFPTFNGILWFIKGFAICPFLGEG